MSGAFCDGFNIGFRIFSIEDALYFLCLRVERCVVLKQRKHIVCCGIYVAPRDGGIDIHGADMTIHWDDSAIPWRDIDSTTNDVFALSQHNSPLNSETKRMKRTLDAKYSKAGI